MAWPLEPAAAALLARSHGVTARLLSSLNGSAFTLPVPLLPGGTVKVDAGSLVRRTLSCEVAMEYGDPRVDPLAAEVRAEYGIVAPSGATVWVPVGTFVITETKEAGRGRLSLSGNDRWQRVQDARLERPVTTSGNTVTALVNLLEGADARITVDASQAPGGSHGSSLWERSREDAIKELARSLGAEVFFDPEGVAVIRRLPLLGDTPAWQVSRGKGGTKISAARGTARGASYNAVVVIAEPQGAAPLYAVARVTSGPLRWGGPFGRRPRFYRTSLVTTQGQAQAMADAMLSRVQGIARTLETESLPNPALDGGDVITVETDPGRWGRHLTQSFTLPLGLGSMLITTRSDAAEDDTDGE